jgi:hypothetical protein
VKGLRSHPRTLSEGDLCTILQTDFGEFLFHALR